MSNFWVHWSQHRKKATIGLVAVVLLIGVAAHSFCTYTHPKPSVEMESIYFEYLSSVGKISGHIIPNTGLEHAKREITVFLAQPISENDIRPLTLFLKGLPLNIDDKTVVNYYLAGMDFCDNPWKSSD